jgi:hypothetical protein
MSNPPFFGKKIFFGTSDKNRFAYCDCIFFSLAMNAASDFRQPAVSYNSEVLRTRGGCKGTKAEQQQQFIHTGYEIFKSLNAMYRILLSIIC